MIVRFLYNVRCASLLLALGFVSASASAQRFAVIGDYGFAGEPERDVAKLVHGWQPEFILTLGDNNYDRGDSTTIDQNIGQYYQAYIYPYKGRYGAGATTNRFFPTLGNHDLYTTNGLAYLKYFTLPGNGRYYDFVRGNVHFFALNSSWYEPDGNNPFSKQARWLKKRLKESKATWKVVYFHHAPYSSGNHGNELAMRWPFQKWGASIVMAGHDHHYERLNIKGTPYIVNGLGGRSLYHMAPKVLKQSQLRYNADYGAMLVEATADNFKLQFVTRTGEVIDTHELGKPTPKPTVSSVPATSGSGK